MASTVFRINLETLQNGDEDGMPFCNVSIFILKTVHTATSNSRSGRNGAQNRTFRRRGSLKNLESRGVGKNVFGCCLWHWLVRNRGIGIWGLGWDTVLGRVVGSNGRGAGAVGPGGTCTVWGGAVRCARRARGRVERPGAPVAEGMGRLPFGGSRAGVPAAGVDIATEDAPEANFADVPPRNLNVFGCGRSFERERRRRSSFLVFNLSRGRFGDRERWERSIASFDRCCFGPVTRCVFRRRAWLKV